MWAVSLVFEAREVWDELKEYKKYELGTEKALELCNLILAQDLHDEDPDGLWGAILTFIDAHDPDTFNIPHEPPTHELSIVIEHLIHHHKHVVNEPSGVTLMCQYLIKYADPGMGRLASDILDTWLQRENARGIEVMRRLVTTAPRL
jgi:hypothetical protein